MHILKVQNLMQRLPRSLIYLKHQSVIGLKNSEECQYTTNIKNNNKSNINYVNEIKALSRQLKEKKEIDFLKKSRHSSQRNPIRKVSIIMRKKPGYK